MYSPLRGGLFKFAAIFVRGGGYGSNKENWMYKLVFLNLNRLKILKLFCWDGQYVWNLISYGIL